MSIIFNNFVSSFQRICRTIATKELSNIISFDPLHRIITYREQSVPVGEKIQPRQGQRRLFRNGKLPPFFTSLHFAARVEFYEVLTNTPHRSNNFSIYISLQNFGTFTFLPPPQNWTTFKMRAVMWNVNQMLMNELTWWMDYRNQS